MVRREEQYWRNTATLFLDTRRSAYSTAMFELAVTAAASVGVHLAGEGFEARLVTDVGEIPSQGSFNDTLLETLAVVKPSRAVGLEAGIEALGTVGGQVIAVLGEVSAEQVRELAATRRGNAPALALLMVEEGAWDTAATASQVLIGAGWQVAIVPDAARLPLAWQEVHRAGGRYSAGRYGSHSQADGNGTGTATGRGTAGGSGPAGVGEASGVTSVTSATGVTGASGAIGGTGHG
jgi:hypothetical protein